MARLTTEQFIDRAKAKHGDRYDYSQVEYISRRIHVNIRCRVHGIFAQTPAMHLGGHNCSKCAHTGGGKLNSYTYEDFVRLAKITHGDRYVYSKEGYSDYQSKVAINCQIHGIFNQVAETHVRGHNCRKCSRLSQSKLQTYTQEEFLELVRLKHGDYYDYSKSIYTLSTKKLTVICPKHGEFQIQANVHLRGCGCIPCGYINRDAVFSEDEVAWSKAAWKNMADRSKNFDSFKIYFTKVFDDTETFYKLGRTFRVVHSRFYRIPYEYEIIKTITHEESDVIFDLENHLKRTFKAYKYKPLKSFGGQHECFTFTPEQIESVKRQMTLTSASDIIPTSS